jgi:hypothetical protein
MRRLLAVAACACCALLVSLAAAPAALAQDSLAPKGPSRTGCPTRSG